MQETEAVATSASEVQATPSRMEEEGRKLELYQGKLKHAKVGHVWQSVSESVPVMLFDILVSFQHAGFILLILDKMAHVLLQLPPTHSIYYLVVIFAGNWS